MKTTILRKLMLIAVLLTGSHAFAHDFEVNGIYYNIISQNDKTLEVTYRGSSSSEFNEYTGDIVIPETISYDNNTYSVTSIGMEAFANCSGLTSAIIHRNVTKINTGAFLKCSGLISITISDNVTFIGECAFYKCTGLISVTIPKSVTEIDYEAFFGCSGLTEVICKSVTPATTYGGTFSNVPRTATLYVPIGCKEAYASATGWNHFINIVEDDTKTYVESTLTDNDVNVSVENGNIIVNGADNATVEVYGANGQCVYNGTATTIPISAKGLYIVKVGNTTHKIIL